jgi:hypothetical protein
MPVCRERDPQLAVTTGDPSHEEACHLDEATKAAKAAELVSALTAGAAS